MKQPIAIETFRPGDLPDLRDLINAADAVDQVDRATTLEQLEYEFAKPTIHPETDCFLAWVTGRLVGYSDLLVRPGNAEPCEACTINSWGVVHPEWRRQGIGSLLLETAYHRASEYTSVRQQERITFHCSARDSEYGRIALYNGFGMQPVRYFANSVRALDGDLPQVKAPAGIRLRTFAGERDIAAIWRVDNEAFRDHWGHTASSLEEYKHWTTMPSFRPEIWFLAEEEATGKVVGLALNIIDPAWIARTGRQEGCIDNLAVLHEYRHRGLGTALLTISLHALRKAGMEAAHLYVDVDNLTGAMRIYERVGFSPRRTSIIFQKVLRNSQDRQLG